MLGVVVQNGTQAGRRIIRNPKTEAWVCECYSTIRNPIAGRARKDRNPASLTRCPRCGTRRP